ncbi:MAG TPA: hypothetical protein VFX59_12495 [Polyangiales bacterium]|nr:hypothetical protein [Polyangiales bacterium]
MKRIPPLSRSLLSSLALLGALAHVPDAHAQDIEIEVEATPPRKSAPAPVPPPPPGPPVNEVAAAPVPPPSEVTKAEVDALRAQLAALEERLRAADTAGAQRLESEQAERAEARRVAEEREKRSLLDRLAKLGVTFSGYIQAQYGQNQYSQDQLQQGANPLNQDRFAIRRGRLRVKGRWQYFRTDFELDASTTRGPTASVRRASVSGVLPSKIDGAPPLLLLTFGLTEIPFGREVQQGQDQILFLERTAGSLAMFAGPVDTGARLDAAYGPLRATFAIMNGTPLDDRAGGPSAIDPLKAPDYIGRISAEAQATDTFRIDGGASFLTGRGFHAGSDATKSVLQWDDSNADGVINAGELVAVAGRGAIPSQSFKHWAVGLDLSFELKTPAGRSRLYGEVTLASNLDRALYVGDPIALGYDVRELNWYVAFLQDITQWGFAGIRVDRYDPNSDFTDNRRGKSVLTDASILTVSPVAGARWPGYGRLTFEYDVIRDKYGRDTRGVPVDLKNNQWTLRFQGEF